MTRTQELKGKERISFFVLSDISEKLNQVAKTEKTSISGIVREAIKSYLTEIEKNKINRELEEGYKANHNYYLKSQKDWEYADKE